MALSKISERGGHVIQGNWDDETIAVAIADGTAKAGMLVGLIAATGVVDGTDTTNDAIVGILLPHHKIDVDAAITGALIVNYVIPKSGHLYGMLCDDQGAHVVGWGTILSANAGLMAPATDAVTENIIARSYTYTSADTVGIFIWS